MEPMQDELSLLQDKESFLLQVCAGASAGTRVFCKITHYFVNILNHQKQIVGVLSDAFVHPIDTCRTRLQVQVCYAYFSPSSYLPSQQGIGPYKGTFDTVTKIIAREGWQSLYKGFAVVASFSIPAHALYFYGYEKTKQMVMPNTPMEEKGSIVHFVAGCVADVCGAFAWVPQVILSFEKNCLHFSSILPGCRETKIADSNK